MKPSVEQISSLLSQRADIRQEEGYWEDFLSEFHHNQRVANTARFVPAAWFDHAKSWLSELGTSRWAYGAGLAYATVTVAFILYPREATIDSIRTTPVIHQVVPASLEQLDHLDLDPSTEGTAGEHVF